MSGQAHKAKSAKGQAPNWVRMVSHRKAKEKRRQELHELKIAAAKTAQKTAERSESKKSTPKTVPARTNISCEQLGKLFTGTIRTSKDEKTPDPVVPEEPKAA